MVQAATAAGLTEDGSDTAAGLTDVLESRPIKERPADSAQKRPGVSENFYAAGIALLLSAGRQF